MRVADDQGQDTKTATVGDPLSLIFEILDPDSPYEIFVRDLVALDGATDAELTLIDERGMNWHNLANKKSHLIKINLGGRLACRRQFAFCTMDRFYF